MRLIIQKDNKKIKKWKIKDIFGMKIEQLKIKRINGIKMKYLFHSFSEDNISKAVMYW